jgi:hypothetical protein
VLRPCVLRHCVPFDCGTVRLLEVDNEEWRPMPPVPFGLLPCNAYAA